MPGTSERCLENPNLLGCFAITEHKPIPDEIGLPMFAIGLIYTGMFPSVYFSCHRYSMRWSSKEEFITYICDGAGWVGAEAMKKLKACRTRLIELGFTNEVGFLVQGCFYLVLGIRFSFRVFCLHHMQELKGMTHYFVLRKVEEVALRGNLEGAKDYLRKVKEVYNFEINWNKAEKEVRE